MTQFKDKATYYTELLPQTQRLFANLISIKIIKKRSFVNVCIKLKYGESLYLHNGRLGRRTPE